MTDPEIEDVRSRLSEAERQLVKAGDRSVVAALAILPATVGRWGPRFGLAFADAFAAGMRMQARGQARRLIEPLLLDGRAVGVGWCRRCGAVVDTDLEERCPRGHALDAVRFVVPADVPSVRTQLQQMQERWEAAYRHGVLGRWRRPARPAAG